MNAYISKALRLYIAPFGANKDLDVVVPFVAPLYFDKYFVGEDIWLCYFFDSYVFSTMIYSGTF